MSRPSTTPVLHGDVVLHGRRYRLDEPAAPEVGSACRAIDVRTGRVVLLKWPETENEDRMLRHEFEMLRALDHEQIPRAVALGRPRGAPHCMLVREWSLGVGLATMLASATLGDVKRLVVLALNALAHVHARGFVHGDRKPEHIRVARDPASSRWHLHLIDFGLACRLDESGRAPLRGGTHGYLAEGASEVGWVTPSEDLYALGRSFRNALGEGAELDPGVDSLLDRLTELQASRRPSDAAAALAALESEGWPLHDLPRARRARLQGREMLLRESEQQIDKLVRRQLGRAIWGIEAPSGAGKTRFLEELASRAMQREVESYAVDLGEFETVDEALAVLLEQVEAPRGDIAASTWPESEHLTQHVGACIRARADATPIWISIDQGSGSAEVAWELGRRLSRFCTRAGPVLVIAAEPPSQPAFEGVRQHQLLPLSLPETHEVLRDIEPTLSTTGVEALAALTQGNPRRAERFARAADILQGSSDGGQISQSGLTRVLKDRIASMDAASQHLLGHLAIVPGAVTHDLLAELLGRDPTGRLTKLDREGLVLPEDGAARSWRIGLPLVRSVVRDVIGEAGVMALHAEALRARQASEQEGAGDAGLLLQHAMGARERGAIQALVVPALTACLAAGRTQEVEARAEALQGTLRTTPILAFTVAILTSEALLKRGTLESATVWIDRAKSILSNHTGAIEPHWRTRFRLAVADLARGQGRLDDAWQTLDTARREAPDHLEPSLRLLVHERLGRVAWSMGDRIRAEQAWLEGVRGLRHEGSDATLGDLWNDLGVAASVRGDLAEARMRYEHSLAARRRAGDLEGAARTLTNLASVSYMRAEMQQARAAYEHALDLKRRLGSRGGEALTLRNLGDLACELGNHARARELLEQCLAIRRQLGDTLGEAGALVVLARLRVRLGQDREARLALNQARARYDELGVTGPDRAVLLWNEADLAMAQGALDKAAVHIGEARTESTRAGASLPPRSTLAALRLAAWRGDWGALEAALPTWSGDAGHHVDRTSQWVVSLWRARLSVERGVYEQALDPLLRVAGQASRAGLEPLAAEALVLLARCGREQGWLDEAANWLQQAAEIEQRLGMPDLLVAVCWEKACQAEARGQEPRAVAWLQRALGAMLPRLDALDPEDQLTFLARTDRHAVVVRHQALIGERQGARSEEERHDRS